MDGLNIKKAETERGRKKMLEKVETKKGIKAWIVGCELQIGFLSVLL